jgi:acyl-CoA thioester hydrolase
MPHRCPAIPSNHLGVGSAWQVMEDERGQADPAAAGRRPVRYELVIRVGADDIDDLGHVNNLVYVRWVQEVARAHWESAARAEDRASLVWVVVRHEIDYLHPAVEGDEIVARTWVESWKGATSHRRTEIGRRSDGTPLARAHTVWCALDARTWRPKRLPTGLSAPFLEEAAEEG